ncbi:MAG TPA: hypothetical protein PKY82_14155 [Pyrinomonadaceae bacterium]|nr:hypothetical protein [Pyrinomonadaceae bacterium]
MWNKSFLPANERKSARIKGRFNSNGKTLAEKTKIFASISVDSRATFLYLGWIFDL